MTGYRVTHLADADHWAKAVRAGSYRWSTRGRSLADEGFIHTAGSHQLAGVADRFYRDYPGDLVLLIVDVPTLETSGSPVIWDDVAGQRFPHAYGPITPDAVVAVLPVAQQHGRCVLPELTGYRVIDADPATPSPAGP